MKKTITIKDLSAVVTGLILALNLPSTVPLWLPVIGGLFAIIVVKQFYGGLGQNFMNPALAARCFLLISFTGRMTNFVFDGMTSSTPLAILKNGESFDLIRMFIGNTAGTIGETSAIALLIGAMYLIVKKVIKVTILGYVYQITKNPIQHQSQQSKQDAYLKVMKEATSFKAYKENDIKKLSKKLKGDYGKNGLEIENALKAYHQKQTIGSIIQVIDHDGFGGDIEIIIGINLQKEITGVEILSIDETVGLGMNAKNEEFRNQYVGKKVDHFQVVKNGKQNEDEVDSLSGATITSKAMTNGINGALDFYDLLKGR